MYARLSQVKTRRFVRVVLGLVASAVSLYLALRNVSFVAVAEALAVTDLVYIGLAFASVAVNTLAKIFRWQVLLGPPGKKIPTVKLSMLVLAGQALNTLSPVRIGDLARVVVLGRQGVGYFFTLGTLLVEKVLDGLSYALLLGLLIIQVPLPAWGSGPELSFLIAIVFAAFVVLLLAYRQQWLLAGLDKLATRFTPRTRVATVARLSEAVAGTEALKDRKSVARLVLWSGLSWGTAILNVVFVLAALQIRLPWTASLLLLILLQAGISVPSIPGRIGVFEYICVLALALFGIDQATAFGFGVVLHAVVLLPTTLLGLLFLWTLGIDGKIEMPANVSEVPPSGVEPSTGKL